MDYSGMTLNERLVVSGLLNEFKQAIKLKKREKVIWILQQLNIDKNSVNAVLKQYGFKLDE